MNPSPNTEQKILNFAQYVAGQKLYNESVPTQDFKMIGQYILTSMAKTFQTYQAQKYFKTFVASSI